MNTPNLVRAKNVITANLNEALMQQPSANINIGFALFLLHKYSDTGTRIDKDTEYNEFLTAAKKQS